MIEDPDEFIAFSAFKSIGTRTIDTLNTWRKKFNGIVQLLGEIEENSGSDILVDLLNKKISLKTGGVATTNIADLAITGAKISNLTITTGKLADAIITTAKLGDASVTTEKLVDDSVTTNKIAAGGITTAKISDLNVTTGKLADLSVTTAKLGNLSVTNAKIANISVTNAKLAVNAVGESNIINGAVTNAKIGASAVQTSNIATSAVTGSKIADGSITGPKVGGSNFPRQMVQDTSSATDIIQGGDGWVDLNLSKAITVQGGSKVRITVTVYGSTNNDSVPMALRIKRNGAGVIGEGNGSGNRVAAGGVLSTYGGDNMSCCALDYTESGLSAGTYTYVIQGRVSGAAYKGYINRTRNDSNNNGTYRTLSSMILTELS